MYCNIQYIKQVWSNTGEFKFYLFYIIYSMFYKYILKKKKTTIKGSDKFPNFIFDI